MWFITIGYLSSSIYAQAPSLQVDFDSSSIGQSLIPVGDDPMFHNRTHVVYGTPEVESLEAIYPYSDSVRVYPSSTWNDIDITPIFNLTRNQMDIWFGDPFADGTRTSFDISDSGFTDLKIDNPIDGFRFRPERLFVVEDRMIAYCSVVEVAVARRNKIAIMSASMTDIQAGSFNPWTLHFVTAEYSEKADEAGGLWAISDPVNYEGAYWSVLCDYVSTDKEGGQAWILKYDSAGTPQQLVRLYMRDNAIEEHWHGGAIIFDGSTYSAVWQIGDAVKRLFFREISSLNNFAINATLDTGSGIDGQYTTLDVSELDWSPVHLAAGPDEDSALTNSQWKNGFLVTQDPNDQSKIIMGGDVGAGLVERLELDSNGIAICHTLFNPMSKNLRQAPRETLVQLNMFMVSRSGQRLVGIVSNEFSQRNSSNLYAGIIQSDDGGNTWGWVWRGNDTLGLSQNSGITVLSNGRIIAGSINDSATVISIIPGGKVSGKPLFVGFRPTNILGTATQQAVLGSVGGQITSIGPNPEFPLPSIVHTENVFDCSLVEGTGGPVIRLVEQGIDSASLMASNMNVAYWLRRKTPTGSDESNRMAIYSRFGWAAPGTNVSWGTATQSYSPTPKVGSTDWVRIVSQYVGSNLSGTFANDPSDLRSIVKGNGIASSTGHSEVLFEYVNIGHDRPSLPFNEFDASGVSSAKYEQLNLGESWSVLAVLQIPEECWDSWSGNETGTWELPVPILSISDSTDSEFITIQGKMTSIAKEGGGPPLTDAVFDWQIIDSQSSASSDVTEYPLRTTSLVIALSKDGNEDLQYVIAGPQGKVSGTRSIPTSFNLDSIRLSDTGESEALEMYVHRLYADCSPLTLSQLETMASTLTFPDLSSTDQCGCRVDINGDNTLNFFDISGFISAFNSNDLSVDFTDDGTLNFFDISAFLNEFAEGCP
ncbi:MAG: GC-type dockerin domain-anchored protein [Phycisphaerales bacterium]|nr:GC-type dockerin domain-anchored protein [Phycisphaerales bacterium]